MKNLYIDAVKIFWFCLMCAIVCAALTLMGLAAFSVGATLAEIRENTQSNFLRFVNNWHL